MKESLDSLKKHTLAGRYILTGGNFSNKGAQAMVFAVVQELKNVNPDNEIWVFSNRDERFDQYKFNGLKWNGWVMLKILLWKLFKLPITLVLSSRERQIVNVLKNTDTIFDVSGFALSSQFDFGSSLRYMLKIILAKQYNIKIILMPQSFGPFNYPTYQRIILIPLMKKYLTYPKMIFARENQGFQVMKNFTSYNLYKTMDVVLQTDDPQPEIIYKQKQKEAFKLNEGVNAVAIIPNIRLLEWNQTNDLLRVYNTICDTIITHSYAIYILRHSKEDLEFCKQIFNNVKNTGNIKLMDKDYSSIDLCDIISKMDFVIASRYHSLIHAYKYGIPAIVIGWAVKYPEVMKEFDQKQYYYDVRKAIAQKELSDNLMRLINNLKSEKECIKRYAAYKRHQNNDINTLFKREQ